MSRQLARNGWPPPIAIRTQPTHQAMPIIEVDHVTKEICRFLGIVISMYFDEQILPTFTFATMSTVLSSAFEH